MIQLEKISKRFGDKQVLDSVDFQFPENEKIALIGINGAGKSTFLDIIAETTEADNGNITAPPRCRICFLPQEPNPSPMSSVIEECVSGHQDTHILKEQMDRFLEDPHFGQDEKMTEKYVSVEAKYKLLGGYHQESKAHSILQGLGFTEQMREKNPIELSGGWRMRLELAKIFMNEPNFLILDEPTNHLDLPSLVWVENYLQKFSGTLLLVSHDRSLLNSLPTRILELSNGKLFSYVGNYKQYLEQKEIRQEHQLAQFEQIESQKKHLQKFVDRFGAKSTKAKQAQSRVKMIEKLGEQQSEIHLEQSHQHMAITLAEPPRSGKVTLKVEDLTIGYPDMVLTKNLSFQIDRGHKVAVIGANGIGKSTLLKTISGLLKPIEGQFESGHQVSISYFAQDQHETLDKSRSVIENIMDLNPTCTELQARSLLGGLLFSGDDVHKPVKVLSGGETSRVGLANALAKNANFLVLDEPTNHLDMMSCDILIKVLSDYQGSVLFVSHDRTFIDSICTHVLAVLPDGRAEIFEGNIQDYIRLAKLSSFPNVLEITQEKKSFSKTKDVQATEKSMSKTQRQEQRVAAKNLQKEIKRTEKNMKSLESKIVDLDKKIEKTRSNDHQVLADLMAQKDQYVSELSKLEDLWLELQG